MRVLVRWLGKYIRWILEHTPAEIIIEPVEGFYCKPIRKTEEAAGYDIYATESFIIEPGEFKSTLVGFNIEMPSGYEGQLRGRSGMTHIDHVTVYGSPDTIDSDYRGIITIELVNQSEIPYRVERGHSIAQLIVSRIPSTKIIVSKRRTTTKRGIGKFGHTGK